MLNLRNRKTASARWIASIRHPQPFAIHPLARPGANLLQPAPLKTGNPSALFPPSSTSSMKTSSHLPLALLVLTLAPLLARAEPSATRASTTILLLATTPAKIPPPPPPQPVQIVPVLPGQIVAPLPRELTRTLPGQIVRTLPGQLTQPLPGQIVRALPGQIVQPLPGQIVR